METETDLIDKEGELKLTLYYPTATNQQSKKKKKNYYITNDNVVHVNVYERSLPIKYVPTQLIGKR